MHLNAHKWTGRQRRIAFGAYLHGMQRGRGGSFGSAREVLAWISLVEAEMFGHPAQ